jgi:phage-related protein
MRVTFFTTSSGRAPVLEYLDRLSTEERARVFGRIAEIEEHGLDSVGVQFRQIRHKLWEIKWTAHRIFYACPRADEIVLLHAYRKAGQKLPQPELKVALRRMKETLQ